LKKVSVIVPCHNSSEYIRNCIDHIINQTIGVDNIELILVDDASDDDNRTTDILFQYEKQYTDNITVICLDKNVRQGGARNAGLEYATGKYIAFCDSDDYLYYDALEKLYYIAEEYSADVVEFDLSTTMRTPKTLNDISLKYTEINTTEERKHNIFKEDSTLGHCNKLYLGDMIRDNKIRFPQGVVFEEPAFTIMVRFIERRNVRIHIPLYHVLFRGDSTMQSDYAPKKYDNFVTHDFLYNSLCEKGFLTDYREEIEYLFWYWYYLNSILFSIHKNCFFTKEELKQIQSRLMEVVPNIKNNQYFYKYWGSIPQLATITYADIDDIGRDTLKDLYTKLNDLC